MEGVVGCFGREVRSRGVAWGIRLPLFPSRMGEEVAGVAEVADVVAKEVVGEGHNSLNPVVERSLHVPDVCSIRPVPCTGGTAVGSWVGVPASWCGSPSAS